MKHTAIQHKHFSVTHYNITTLQLLDTCYRPSDEQQAIPAAYSWNLLYTKSVPKMSPSWMV